MQETSNSMMSYITEGNGSVGIKNVLNSLLPLLGVLAVLRGWSRYTDEPPKPSEEDQITHTDYISGNYQRDLEQRQEEINRLRSRGRWMVIAGTSLLVSGLYMLSRGLYSAEEK